MLFCFILPDLCSIFSVLVLFFCYNSSGWTFHLSYIFGYKWSSILSISSLFWMTYLSGFILDGYKRIWTHLARARVDKTSNTKKRCFWAQSGEGNIFWWQATWRTGIIHMGLWILDLWRWMSVLNKHHLVTVTVVINLTCSVIMMKVLQRIYLPLNTVNYVSAFQQD